MIKVLRFNLASPYTWASIAVVALMFSISCSADGERGETSPTVGVATQVNEVARPDFLPLHKGPLSPEGFQVILGTSDLGVGTNRFTFVLTSQTGIVDQPTVKITSFRKDGESPNEEVQSTFAVFRPWPYGTRGMYTTQLRLDEAGTWEVEVLTRDSQGATTTARIDFQVNEITSAPMSGAPAVKTVSKTIEDVDSLAELTTGSLHDPDLYQRTIADAAESGLPSVVVMASPAFCTNAVCGPQVEVLQQLKERYKGQANFIHVDFYDNPSELQGDLTKARLSPTVIEWNLPSTEWSFVIDRGGMIAARFESFATLTELEEALRPLL